jgi:hypothetical protein
LKLVIRKSDGKVLYAQGEQDFANLLLSFLTFPLGGIARIFGENCSLGSINELYKSIAGLNENKYLISKEAKNRLVYPCISPQIKLSKPVLPILQPDLGKYYGYRDNNYPICALFNKSGEYLSHAEGLLEMKFSIPTSLSGQGYVKGPAMYVATDDLTIAPLSPISALALLSKLKTPLNDLKEKVVTIGVKEVKFIKAHNKLFRHLVNTFIFVYWKDYLEIGYAYLILLLFQCLSILKAALTSKYALTNGLAHLLTEVKVEK